MRQLVAAAFAWLSCCSPASAGPAVAPGSIDPPSGPSVARGSIFRALSKSSLAAALGRHVSVEKVIGADGEERDVETALFAKRRPKRSGSNGATGRTRSFSGVEVFGSKWVGPPRSGRLHDHRTGEGERQAVHVFRARLGLRLAS